MRFAFCLNMPRGLWLQLATDVIYSVRQGYSSAR